MYSLEGDFCKFPLFQAIFELNIIKWQHTHAKS